MGKRHPARFRPANGRETAGLRNPAVTQLARPSSGRDQPLRPARRNFPDRHQPLRPVTGTSPTGTSLSGRLTGPFPTGTSLSGRLTEPSPAGVSHTGRKSTKFTTGSENSGRNSNRDFCLSYNPFAVLGRAGWPAAGAAPGPGRPASLVPPAGADVDEPAVRPTPTGRLYQGGGLRALDRERGLAQRRPRPASQQGLRLAVLQSALNRCQARSSISILISA